ncbi:hypothetical protein [Algoriphagus mannitolivorans]|uniref:hypothetical protein n=1 Tax=Algoriphagus mannitolivorans TaxID=226504 RepID=UPI0003FA63F3|nr:hypothetical protein [Algoriphagus mannitolivorans]
MKIIGSFLILFMGTIGMALAQHTSDTLNYSKDSLLIGEKLKPSLKLDSLNSGGILVDSSYTFLPRSLYTERTLDFSPSPKFRVGMPTYKLADPQSRMPVKGFDDSVNYTLQIKKYD